MSVYIELDNFINMEFHNELGAIVKNALTFFTEVEINELTEEVVSDKTSMEARRLYLTAYIQEVLVKYMKTYGIITTEPLLKRLLEQCLFLRYSVTKEVPEHLLEAILEYPTIAEGYSHAVCEFNGSNDYAEVLSNITTIKDEFQSWVHETILSYSDTAEKPSKDRTKTLSKIKKLGEVGLIGEYLIKVSGLDIGLDVKAYVNSLEEDVLEAMVVTEKLPSHIASIVILTGSDGKYNEHNIRETVNAINNVDSKHLSDIDKNQLVEYSMSVLRSDSHE